MSWCHVKDGMTQVSPREDTLPKKRNPKIKHAKGAIWNLLFIEHLSVFATMSSAQEDKWGISILNKVMKNLRGYITCK